VQEQKKRLKAQGETYQRLRLLEDWRIQTIFSVREKAALHLAEAFTRNPISTVSEVAVYVAMAFFDKTEIFCLILAILAINDWCYLNQREAAQLTAPAIEDQFDGIFRVETKHFGFLELTIYIWSPVVVLTS
jgi:alkylhydroperoxidase family enzyme